jgi:hypothetical protein
MLTGINMLERGGFRMAMGQKTRSLVLPSTTLLSLWLESKSKRLDALLLQMLGGVAMLMGALPHPTKELHLVLQVPIHQMRNFLLHLTLRGITTKAKNAHGILVIHLRNPH